MLFLASVGQWSRCLASVCHPQGFRELARLFERSPLCRSWMCKTYAIEIDIKSDVSHRFCTLKRHTSKLHQVSRCPPGHDACPTRGEPQTNFGIDQAVKGDLVLETQPNRNALLRL